MLPINRTVAYISRKVVSETIRPGLSRVYCYWVTPVIVEKVAEIKDLTLSHWGLIDKLIEDTLVAFAVVCDGDRGTTSIGGGMLLENEGLHGK
jgi:hypothetical protein